jgi:hypothetical protein
LFAPAPHTGTTLDLLLTGGFALTVIGVLILLGTAVGRIARLVLSPVIGAGSAPLTVYSAHVILVGIVTSTLLPKSWESLTYLEFAELGTPWYLSSPVMFAINMVLALLIGTLLVVIGRRGPLETFVTWMGQLLARHRGTGGSKS